MSRVNGSPGYSYGWPSGGTEEPDVAAQWLFDEASGNIVDEVNSITLMPQPNAGEYSYQVAATGAFEGLSPGVTSTGYPNFSNFEKGSAETLLDINDADFVVEAVASVGTITYGQSIFHDENFIFKPQNTGTTNFQIYLKASDGTAVIWNGTYSGTTPIDGTVRKFRLAGDRSGSMEYFVDGVSYGTSSLSTLAGKNVVSNNPSVLGRLNTDYALHGTILELRLTIGNATNNSGGPNGG